MSENEIPKEQAAQADEVVPEVEASEASEQSQASEQDVELSPEGLIEQLQEEVAAAKDTALRATAEAQNAKRRADQEVEKARKFALERFCNELLPVVDNLERALESAQAVAVDEVKPITEGVELTLKSFIDALGRCNVEQLDPHGEPFDPNFHQAMSMVESADAEPNTVIAVMQKGYSLNGRLVRPAMVMVSK